VTRDAGSAVSGSSGAVGGTFWISPSVVGSVDDDMR